MENLQRSITLSESIESDDWQSKYEEAVEERKELEKQIKADEKLKGMLRQSVAYLKKQLEKSRSGDRGEKMDCSLSQSSLASGPSKKRRRSSEKINHQSTEIIHDQSTVGSTIMYSQFVSEKDVVDEIEMLKKENMELAGEKSHLIMELNEARRRIEEIESNAESMKQIRIKCMELENDMEILRKDNEAVIEGRESELAEYQKRSEEYVKEIKQFKQAHEDLINDKSELTRALGEACEKLDKMESCNSESLKTMKNYIENLRKEREEQEAAKSKLALDLKSALKTTQSVILQQKSDFLHRERLQSDVNKWVKWYEENLRADGTKVIPPSNLHTPSASSENFQAIDTDYRIESQCASAAHSRPLGLSRESLLDSTLDKGSLPMGLMSSHHVFHHQWTVPVHEPVFFSHHLPQFPSAQDRSYVSESLMSHSRQLNGREGWR